MADRRSELLDALKDLERQKAEREQELAVEREKALEELGRSNGVRPQRA